MQTKVAQVESPVCVILAAGRGTRMRSQTTHKVCFPISGRPAILRALDNYTAGGLTNFHVVVGALAGQVMETVTAEYSQATFVYQAEQRGTGHAVRVAVEPLLTMGYTGPVIITMGDKLIDPQAVEKLVHTFSEGSYHAVVGVLPRQPKSSGGRVLLRSDGDLAGIVEARDIQRAAIFAEAYDQVAAAVDATATVDVVAGYARELIPDSKKRRVALGELFDLLETGDGTGLAQTLEALDRDAGRIRLGGDVFTPDEADNAPYQNAAFYMFDIAALHEGLQRITADNAQGEEYLTDVVNVLANDVEGKYRVGYCEFAPDDILTYNNPEELVAVEEAFRKRLRDSGVLEVRKPYLPRDSYRTVSEWLSVLQSDDASVRLVLREIYGDDPALWKDRVAAYKSALERFGDLYGYDRKVVLVRAPGRINLMGRHIEHRGGTVNVMALNKEAVLVAAPNDDDVVRVSNTDPEQYPDVTFSIGDEIAHLPWDDWLEYINHEHVQRLVYESGGSWVNYVKAALLRLQFQFREQQIRGMDIVFTGNIPVAAGLSSSSAVVVATAEASIALNGLDVVPQDFVDLCGEGEWYVGSRGGAGDHAAMKFSRSGEVTHIGFFPFQVKGSTPFPEGYELLIANSHIKAQKMTNAKDTFNQRVASYEIGLLLLRERFPKMAAKLERLRDLHPSRLGIRPSELYNMLLALPEKLTQAEVVQLLGSRHGDALQTIFRSHAEPDHYLIRSVVLYGAAECARAELCREYLARGDMEGLGRLMQISHDGDRVVKHTTGAGGWTCGSYDYSASDAYLEGLIDDLRSEDPERVARAQLHLQPGGYACSTPEIDEMVDLSMQVPGVLGAQLSGAGLGGCIMVLVRSEAKQQLKQVLTERFYGPRGLTPQITESTPVMGSMLVRVPSM